MLDGGGASGEEKWLGIKKKSSFNHVLNSLTCNLSIVCCWDNAGCHEWIWLAAQGLAPPSCGLMGGRWKNMEPPPSLLALSLSLCPRLSCAACALSLVHTHPHTHSRRPSCWWCCLNRLIGNYGRGTRAVFFPSLPQWAGLFHLCGLLAFQLTGGGASTALMQMREGRHLKKWVLRWIKSVYLK